MNNKDRKRHIAYEALVILGLLALLNFICRLWPILLLIILGIFIAAIRLLFLSSKKVEVIEPFPLVPAPVRQPTEQDVQTLAYAIVLRRVTELVLADFPNARWVWETPDAKRQLLDGRDVFILLNHAGGYRRAKVIVNNLQVVGIMYVPKCQTDEIPIPEIEAEQDLDVEKSQNFELLAFEWVDAHIFELNTRCNEAIGENLSELILLSEELPVRDSWPDICKELIRAGLEDVKCVSEGIKISLTQ